MFVLRGAGPRNCPCKQPFFSAEQPVAKMRAPEAGGPSNKNAFAYNALRLFLTVQAIADRIGFKGADKAAR
ncbi:hypothetical protein BN77_2942 [Rhizobium mesoamericanum STM3625]|uniref:Uncharacterized protein n=1 Tax=Rhizobium mesoamericanum STM3625 TaxID=1211777 RepID=K0PH09_9HYPH|nr:hypothetical protein BN77_2942 [Rhizobium mesoamericanum STM3625]